MDTQFQETLHEAMLGWRRVHSFGMDTLLWWEVIVKPGVRKLAKTRAFEIAKERKGELSLLLVRQAYLNKKVKLGHLQKLGDLRSVHHQIQQWYQRACEKIKDQSRALEFQSSEKVTIYHHEIHRKLIKKSSILKLETPAGLIEGHAKCAEYLEN